MKREMLAKRGLMVRDKSQVKNGGELSIGTGGGVQRPKSRRPIGTQF